MIGTDLNLTLPSTTETMATNIARIATALQSIEDSIAERVSPAGININAPLDMQGNVLTDVAALQFASGNVPSTAGSFYYFNGAWYAVDDVGIIQLTENGALKASGFGAIAGDYGGINPAAVTYVDANGQYVFTEDTGIYADIVCDDVILKGTNGTLTVNVDDALTGSREINIADLPASGVAALVYDANSSTLKNAASTRATGEQKFTNLDVSGNITLGGSIKHSVRTITLPFIGSELIQTSGTNSFSSTGFTVDVLSGGTATWRQSIPLRLNERVTYAKVYINSKPNNSFVQLKLMRRSISDGIVTTTMIDSVATQSSISTPTLLLLTVDSPVAKTGWEHYYLEVVFGPTLGNHSCEVVTEPEVGYDLP